MPLNSEIVSILIYFLSVQWSRHRNPGYGQEETCSKLSLKKFEVLYQTSHFTAEIKFNILFTVGFIVEVITYPPGGPHLLTLEIKGLDSDFNSECFYKLIGSPYIQYDICSETLSLWFTKALLISNQPGQRCRSAHLSIMLPVSSKLLRF